MGAWVTGLRSLCAISHNLDLWAIKQTTPFCTFLCRLISCYCLRVQKSKNVFQSGNYILATFKSAIKQTRVGWLIKKSEFPAENCFPCNPACTLHHQ
ncbi:hypothetical protein L596_020293 [Steinernema carpocapsae]|uniref:Uncharacterized protein n=1 Tax=Steinernema carpocapsae TaxID=34508 RepID=A0A4U5MT36_STECR|nr:hypothetical protein L596_020293 [Steinernema carpocapsae]